MNEVQVMQLSTSAEPYRLNAYDTDKTPIEVLLQVDEDGTVSTRNVYEFLGLEPVNFTTWCKRNILDNEFADENSDYHEVFFKKDFVTPSGGNHKRTLIDYKLTTN